MAPNLVKQDAAHNSLFQTSDFIAVVVLLVGGVIEFLFGRGWSLPVPLPVRLVVGIAIGLVGFSLIGACKRALKAASQPTEPGKPTTQLVRSGIFAYSRNPTYIGLSLMLLGIGIAANMLTWMVGSVLALVAMYVFLVLPEERYLAARFPAEYEAWSQSVRRWI